MSQLGIASCAVCGETSVLTSHHIHPREYKETYPMGPENINERANLVILCSGCHSAVHDKRPFQQMIRDIKTKLRQKLKSKPGMDEEQKRQSLKDQEIQRQVWKRLLSTLQDKDRCSHIEEYRRIIRLVSRIHRSTLDDFA